MVRTATLVVALLATGLPALAAGARAGAAHAGDAVGSAWSTAAVRSIARPAGVAVVEGGQGSASERIDALERAGYRVAVAVLPSLFFVQPASGAGPVPDGFRIPAEIGTQPAAAEAGDVDPFGGVPCILPPLEGTVERSRPGPERAAVGPGLPYGAGWESTSELMVGRVAVPILFPESDGTFDPDHYDWTPALRDSIIRSATRGFLKWTAVAAARGIPLTFLLEVYPALPTRYEPIDRSVLDRYLWIEDALEPIVGYRGDAVAMAYELANGARARLGTQWAALLFAVQNDTDPDGAFADGYIANAQLGGPWFIVPVNNLQASVPLDYYMEHEMTHMFWALDEYPANNAWWSCSLTTGYFDQFNSNSALPAPGYCGLDRRCLMKGAYPDSFCVPTLNQVGWVDQKPAPNGVPDIYETRPSVRVDSTTYHATVGVPLTVHGKAVDIAWANVNPYQYGFGDSITIATIDSLWYRIDGVQWQPLAPDDGVFDEGLETFTLLLPSLGLGDHVVDFLARNSSGRTGEKPDSVSVTVAGGAGTTGGWPDGGAGYSITVSPVPSAGPVRFALTGPRAASGTARLFDVAGRRVAAWPVQVPGSGRVDWTWSPARNGNAPAGLYFLTVEIDGQRLTRRVVLLH